MGILNLLSEEKGLLDEMLDTLKKEKSVLIKDDIEGIKSASQKIVELKSKIHEMEKKRISLYGNARLKELLSRLEPSERLKAESMGNEIKALVRDIDEENKTNTLLLKQSLGYARCMINIMSPAQVTTYKPTGKIENSTPDSSILNRSI